MNEAWQYKIRQQKAIEDKPNSFVPEKPKIVDIKNAIVKEVSRKTAESIILQYEWLGTMGTTNLHNGIYFDGFLGGVVCYGYFQSMEGYSTYVGDKYSKKGIQLTKGACVYWAHKHSASKLISASLKEIQKLGYKYVIAFSDSQAGEIGTVYQASNFYYLGYTNHSPHYNLCYPNGTIHTDCRDIQKKFGISSYKDKLVIANKKGLILKKIENKARYIYLLGTQIEKRQMLEILNHKILPYPKRESTKI